MTTRGGVAELGQQGGVAGPAPAAPGQGRAACRRPAVAGLDRLGRLVVDRATCKAYGTALLSPDG
ncbi:hypothetical protein PYK79_16615 [Streptomyces sp. ID05-04B]|uniref:hypothetical protein n=1 Tax=unclassified Streptomyces TaxID=2593676 RepID=UPI000D1A5D7B|nr:MULTISPECIES: hypothetical protein [unclassified Streptomyces]AVV42801.1 hypothetical protein C6376_16615 [Streptomyces sp. P3]MDX5564632.1 hypothetical protein [Streptomyces sp. ID05-04B]